MTEGHCSSPCDATLAPLKRHGRRVALPGGEQCPSPIPPRFLRTHYVSLNEGEKNSRTLSSPSLFNSFAHSHLFFPPLLSRAFLLQDTNEGNNNSNNNSVWNVFQSILSVTWLVLNKEQKADMNNNQLNRCSDSFPCSLLWKERVR